MLYEICIFDRNYETNIYGKFKKTNEIYIMKINNIFTINGEFFDFETIEVEGEELDGIYLYVYKDEKDFSNNDVCRTLRINKQSVYEYCFINDKNNDGRELKLDVKKDYFIKITDKRNENL